MPTSKIRISVQTTEEEAARLNALLGELKRRRLIPQTETVNRLILRLALECAGARERELRKK